MDLTIQQKKKHLLLLNRLYRMALKEELIPTPSKLSEDKIEALFTKLFMKKDNFFIPKVKNQYLVIDEDEFKKLIPKTKQPKEKVKKEVKSEPKAPEPKKEEPKAPEPKKEEKKMTFEDESNKKLIELLELYYNCSMKFKSASQNKINIGRKERNIELLKDMKKKYNIDDDKTFIIKLKKEIESRFKKPDDLYNWVDNFEETNYQKKCFLNNFKSLYTYLNILSKQKEEENEEKIQEEKNKPKPKEFEDFKDASILADAIRQVHFKDFGRNITNEVSDKNSIKELVDYIKKTFDVKRDMYQNKYSLKEALNNIKESYNKQIMLKIKSIENKKNISDEKKKEQIDYLKSLRVKFSVLSL